MSIRLDPRRLSALKLLAAEAGMRPGELVTAWVEERIDAARAGQEPSPPSGALAELSARLDELARRVDALVAAADGRVTVAAPTPADAEAPAPALPRRGRSRPGGEQAGEPAATGGEESAAGAPASGREDARRVPLHEEIAAVIAERGPMTAAELARAITERGRYAAPRSARPLDAATINSRVSNPVYRARFTRADGRIGLVQG